MLWKSRRKEAGNGKAPQKRRGVEGKWQRRKRLFVSPLPCALHSLTGIFLTYPRCPCRAPSTVIPVPRSPDSLFPCCPRDTALVPPLRPLFISSSLHQTIQHQAGCICPLMHAQPHHCAWHAARVWQTLAKEWNTFTQWILSYHF